MLTAQRKAMARGVMSLCVATSLACALATDAAAGLIQWRNRVPAGAANPDNVGSYANTIETGNGGTLGYDPGLDVDLDTSILPPGVDTFVTYVDHGPEKVEYEFTQSLAPGSSYTARLSFEMNGTVGAHLISNAIEFLVVDGRYQFALEVDANGDAIRDVFRSGRVTLGEMESWNQFIFSGQDHRNGFSYGTLTITALAPIANADANDDGQVDGRDFLLWQRGYGASGNAMPNDGDFNDDQAVDGQDLAIWQEQFGTMPAIATVAEPAASALALLSALGVVVVVAWRTQQRRLVQGVAGFVALVCFIVCQEQAAAGLLAWTLKVPDGEASNIGSWSNTLQSRNDLPGVSLGWDQYDIPLDTSINPNDQFFVSYFVLNGEKYEYAFTPELAPGDSLTVDLSIENRTSEYVLTSATIEFYAMDFSDAPNGVTDFSYSLDVDTDFNGINDYFDSGKTSEILGQELPPWTQTIYPGYDHRNGIDFKFGTLTITALAPIANADGNNDGHVDGRDFLLWQRGYGASGNAMPGDGDFNDDQAVDAADLAIWQDQFGNAASVAIVPEPATLGLALLGSIPFVRWECQWRRRRALGQSVR